MKGEPQDWPVPPWLRYEQGVRELMGRAHRWLCTHPINGDNTLEIEWTLGSRRFHVLLGVNGSRRTDQLAACHSFTGAVRFAKFVLDQATRRALMEGRSL